MNFIGNIIWLIFGGFISALAYLFGGFVLCFTIIGIPFGLQCFKLATFILWPFGSKIVYANNGGGCLQTIGNIIWLFTGGLCAAISHFIFGCLLFISIIGIPFGRKHFQLIELSLMPFGKKIVAV
ncbi:MAG TPA: YccF domain-containing protein [Chitinophagaceae bacterium]|nr:YccF domain-containing protein [Chitinophagaceae bacterium]